MVIFHRSVSDYQRVYTHEIPLNIIQPPFSYGLPPAMTVINAQNQRYLQIKSIRQRWRGLKGGPPEDANGRCRRSAEKWRWTWYWNAR